jgi:hypothetical protein
MAMGQNRDGDGIRRRPERALTDDLAATLAAEEEASQEASQQLTERARAERRRAAERQGRGCDGGHD